MRRFPAFFALAVAVAVLAPARAQEGKKPDEEKPALPDGKKEGAQEPTKKAEEPKKPEEPKKGEAETPPVTTDDAKAAFAAFTKLDDDLQKLYTKLQALEEVARKAAEAYHKARAELQKKVTADPNGVAEAKKEFEPIEKAFMEKRNALMTEYNGFEQIRQKAVEAFAKAGRTIEGALKARPEEVELKLLKVRLQCVLGQFREGLPLAETTAKALPEDFEAQLALAKCYLGTNQFEAAVKILTALGEKNPKSREVTARLSLALYAANDFAGSQKHRDALGADLADLNADLRQTLEAWDPRPLAALWTKELEARKSDAKKDDLPRAKLETTKGVIVIELFEDVTPNTVANWISLIEKGYYDKTTFHRVIPQFMAQGGDPKGTGEGGPGYRIKDELDEKKNRHHFRGTLSMAKTAEPDSGGSQFFLCTVPTAHLNGIHTVFGRILEGQDVVDKLEIGDEITKATVVRKRAHEYKPETLREKTHNFVPAPDGDEEGHEGHNHGQPPKGEAPKGEAPKGEAPKGEAPK